MASLQAGALTAPAAVARAVTPPRRAAALRSTCTSSTSSISSAAKLHSSGCGSRMRCRRAAALRPCAMAGTRSPARPIEPPFGVVITGGSKGVGRALAEGFLRAGDSVVICARDGAAVDAAVAELRALAAQLPPSREGRAPVVAGIAANVAKPAEVAALADFAKQQLGEVDLWINNAGTNAYRVGPLAAQDPEDIIRIVETNTIGLMLATKEAIRVMKDQTAGGHIFLMDGAGADGGATPRFAAYGATKRGLNQLSKSLRMELRSEGLKKIGVHNLSPGMVTTELLLAGTNTPVARWFVNCLAEEPLTVADYLVPRIRAVPAASRSLLPWDEPGAVGQHQYIRFLTQAKAYSQILKRLLTGERKNRFVPEDCK